MHASDPRPLPRTHALGEGILAGLALGVFDWLAAGVGRVPAGVLVAILVWGLLAGLLAGGVAILVRRRGVALGLVVWGATCLHAASTYTKSIGPPRAEATSLVALALLFLLAVGAGVVAGRGRSLARGPWWALLVLAAIPGASLAWGAVPPTAAMLCLTCTLPLAVGVVGAWGRVPARTEVIALPLAIVALVLPSLLADAKSVAHVPPASVDVRAPDGAPNVVLVIVDTLRHDHAFPDDATTTPPTLARLAREGVRFDQTVASAPWTLPSVASLLTSQHPSHHGAVTQLHRLPADVDTLADLMHGAGYETAAFTGGAFVSPAYGLDQGFEVFDHEAEFHFLPFRGHVPFVWRLIKNRYVPLRFLLRRVREYGGVPILAGRVRAWLAHHDGTRPFFLLVHTYQVHDYYIYQPGPDDPLLAERGGPPAHIGSRLAIHPNEFVDASQEKIDWYHEIYARRVGYVDREVGELLARIESAVGPGNLVTIVTSDHGEGFDASRHRVHHGGRLHDDLVRVPLVLRAPGRVPSGLRVGEQVRLLDVMPTVLDLAGLDVPEGLEGRSLVPFFGDGEEASREAWSEQHSEVRLVSLRTPLWKLVDTGRGEEFYRLDTDPLEDHPAEDALPDQLRTWWDTRRELLAPRAGQESAVDAATLDQLRRIGY